MRKAAPVKFMQKCETCGHEFQFGPNLYDGKHIPRYNITVCMTCWKSNWDGWAPRLELQVTAKFVEKGLPIPERNAEGLLPRD
jgi:hypothetical protein